MGQIGTLVFISYDRFNVIVRGFNAKPLTYCRVFTFLLIIWIYASFWAVGPLVGYGTYALDGILASCSYGYMDQSLTNVVYILSMFGFGYVFNLTLIILFYLFIVKVSKYLFTAKKILLTRFIFNANYDSFMMEFFSCS